MKKLLFILLMVSTLACVREDVVPPVISLVGSAYIELELYDTYVEYGAVAFDETDGDISPVINISNDIKTYVLGKYEVIYTATDMAGNTGMKKRTVNVVFKTNNDTILADTIPPIITLYGNNPMFLDLMEEYVEYSALAVDNIYGDLTQFIYISNNVNVMNSGIYFVYYSVSDFSNNISTVYRKVVVGDDEEPPVITILGDNPFQLIRHAEFVDPGATAHDNYDGDLTSQIQIGGNLNIHNLGNYIVTYTVSDQAGNVGIDVRDVVVINN